MMESLQAFAQMANDFAATANVIAVVFLILSFIFLTVFVPVDDEDPTIWLIRQSGARTRRRMEQLKDEAVAKAKEGRYEED